MARTLPRPAICLVTPGREDQGTARPVAALIDRVARASAAGVDLVQLREPHLSDAALFGVLERVLSAVDRGRTAILVNDRTDLAIASQADGVHLRSDAMPASRVRSVVPETFLVGRSVHSTDEARAAEIDGGVDYLIFGTVFPTPSKPADHSAAGVAGLREVCSAVRLPVLAIGGIDIDRLSEVRAAGAAGVAAIGMFAAADRGDPEDVREIVQRVRQAFDCW
jgi:thiamine-phosphate pyrophosphorylase